MKLGTTKLLLEEAALTRDGDDPGFCALVDSGGNYDDAYYMGVADGRIGFARLICKLEGLGKGEGK